MKSRIAAAILAGAVAGACAGRGVEEEPEDEEAREVCEGLCSRWIDCGPPFYETSADCMEDCRLGPYGEENPARWDDACRAETLESRGCFAELSCEDWLGLMNGTTEKSPAQDECEDLALDETVCRQRL